MTTWAGMDETTPKDRKLLLLCPWTDSPDGTGSHPDAKMNNGRVVGWWSTEENAWVAGLPGGPVYQVYPSRWTELADEPT
jgi:hypothetical protein